MNTTTRREWLSHATVEASRAFKQLGYGVLDLQIVESSTRLKHRGCQDVVQIGTNSYLVGISPEMEQPTDVVLHVLHSMAHAVLFPNRRHDGAFVTIREKLNIHELANDIASDLGPYPGSDRFVQGGPKSTIRMLKLQCTLCGCTIRTTQKWITQYDHTSWPCPCGEGQLS